MKRTYLEEDLELVQKYFPGARTTTLRTPFDLSRPRGRLLNLDLLDANAMPRNRLGGVLWMN